MFDLFNCEKCLKPVHILYYYLGKQICYRCFMKVEICPVCHEKCDGLVNYYTMFMCSTCKEQYKNREE